MDNASPLALALAGTTILATSVVVYKLLTNSSSSSGEPKESAAAVVKDDRPKLLVYFGSQTGTAEGLGRVIEREGGEKGFNVQVVDLEDWDEDSSEDFTRAAKEAAANVFLMATYGEGEPTDNAADFIKLLKAETEEVRGRARNPLRGRRTRASLAPLLKKRIARLIDTFDTTTTNPLSIVVGCCSLSLSRVRFLSSTCLTASSASATPSTSSTTPWASSSPRN